MPKKHKPQTMKAVCGVATVKHSWKTPKKFVLTMTFEAPLTGKRRSFNPIALSLLSSYITTRLSQSVNQDPKQVNFPLPKTDKTPTLDDMLKKFLDQKPPSSN